jgi:hypothetical protein
VTQEEHLGEMYDSPHIWIVALIGSDQFKFSDSYEKEFRRELNHAKIATKGKPTPNNS